jgi:dihydrofolate reductase
MTRKLISFLHMSLDGVVEGPQGPMDIGFVAYDQDLESEADKVLATADTIVWGRGTYQGMNAYWPTMKDNAEANAHERHHAEWIEKVEKIVFSRTLSADEVTWENSTLVSDNIVEKIEALKALDGQDMVILGSPRLTQELFALGLIDEFKLTVSPVLVGQGLHLFENVAAQTNLKLLEQKTFDSGLMSVHYQVEK